jgi:hypothetical protein
LTWELKQKNKEKIYFLFGQKNATLEWHSYVVEHCTDKCIKSIVIILERTAKVLPQFLLDNKKEKRDNYMYLHIKSIVNHGSYCCKNFFQNSNEGRARTQGNS